MRGVNLLACLGIVAAGASAFATAPSAIPARMPYPHPRSYYEAHVDLAEPERARIQAHLSKVEAILRANPPKGLSAGQRKNRLARLDDLHEYWTRGEFPKNRDFPDRLVPYFIDAKGVPCAMGYLVIRSGGGDFAEEIRRRMNNAYIAEIAAADGRLAAWAKAQGMTLREAAMVQPGYGPPRLSAVWKVGLDPSGRPWAMGADANLIGNISLFYRDSSQWIYDGAVPYSAPGFCFNALGEALLVSGSQFTWKGSTTQVSGMAVGYQCAWSGDSVAWTGGHKGLARLLRNGSNVLVRQQFTAPITSDTVTAVATVGNIVWAATPRGVFRRLHAGTDTIVTLWDSTWMGGRRITGLVAGRGALWAGVEGVVNGYTTGFSTRGLRRFDGTDWLDYRAAQSSTFVPGDTVYALAVRDSSSAWIALRTGFYRFAPGVVGGGATQKVADIPSGATVYDMAGDAQGFYAGTSLGVYRYEGDTLTFLGQPAAPVLSARRLHAPVKPSGLTLRLSRPREAPDALTIQGRKTGPRAAAGVYVTPPDPR